jgi:signal transduction histidine kinase
MTTLVNNLLFLAKTDDAKNNEIYSNVNFSDTLWSSMLPLESLIYEQEKILESNIEPDIFVRGDESKLKQLIVILIDNACKYSEKKGKIIVELSKKQDKVKLTVKNNTGEIIPKDQIDNIFVRFYRVDKSRAREKGGYGLGLAIAESIVKSHNGKISVESIEETGTTFTVTFQTAKKRV